jgi:hypothetical protein
MRFHEIRQSLQPYTFKMLYRHLNNIFIVHPASHPRGTGGIFLEAKRLDHESVHSSPSTAEVSNEVDFTSIIICVVMAWCLGTGITLLILHCNWSWLVTLLCKIKVYKFVIDRIPSLSQPVSHNTAFQITTESTSSGNKINYGNTSWRQLNELRGKLHRRQ